jgi:hypothetical protein
MRILFVLALCFAAHADEQDDTFMRNIIDKSVPQAQEGCTHSKGCVNYENNKPLAPDAVAEVERRSMPDFNGRQLPISVVRVEDLKRLRDIMPYNLAIYDDSLCQQRAHMIGHDLASHGIETVKILLYPKIGHSIIPDDKLKTSRGKIPQWPYHTANVILVKEKDSRVRPYVIDPLMNGRPVPQEDWERRLRTNPESSIETQRIISRFNYGPGKWVSDENQVLTDYVQYKVDFAKDKLDSTGR